MIKHTKLYHGTFYHIYNRGNNKENLFYEEENYRYFLKLYQKHVMPIADTYAYCLLKNHFHFLIRIKTVEELYPKDKPDEIEKPATSDSENKPDEVKKKTSRVVRKPSQYFSNLFNAYAKAVNRKYNRIGSLFQDRYKRKLVGSDTYFLNLIHYIHFNPQKHGFVKDFRQWRYSSYNAILSEKPTDLNRKDVLDWFSGKDEFIEYHKLMIQYQKEIGHLIEDD